MLCTTKSIGGNLKKCNQLGKNLFLRTTLFNTTRQLFAFPNITNKRKIYEKKKLVGYSDQQMFNVVSDVDNYEKFLPWCTKSYVYCNTPTFLKGDLVIGFPPLTESYTSNVTLKSPDFIRAECVDGRLFSYFLTIWRFSKGLKDIPQSCVIDINVAFEFKLAIHSKIAHIFFDQVIKQMEDAFIKEAKNRYGKPAIRSHILMHRSS